MHFLSDVLFAVVSSLFRITAETKQKQPWERETVSSVRKVWEIGVKITVFADWWKEIGFGLNYSVEITKNQGQWRIQGRGWGTQGLPYFWTKLRPEGMRKISFKTVPPSYLRVACPPPSRPPPPPPQHTPLSEGLDLTLKGSRNRDSTVGRNYEWNLSISGHLRN